MIRGALGGSVTGARWRIRNCRVAACTVSLNYLGVRGRPKIDSPGLAGARARRLGGSARYLVGGSAEVHAALAGLPGAAGVRGDVGVAM